jgi:hypothetical protein
MSGKASAQWQAYSESNLAKDNRNYDCKVSTFSPKGFSSIAVATGY